MILHNAGTNNKLLINFSNTFMDHLHKIPNMYNSKQNSICMPDYTVTVLLKLLHLNHYRNYSLEGPSSNKQLLVIIILIIAS